MVSKNASCKILMAFFTSSVLITAEIFLSDEPCAMARIFTPFRPSAPNILPLTPVWFFILSPTMAMMDKCFSSTNGCNCPIFISYSKALSTASFAFIEKASSIPTQIECSDDACVINITLIDAFASASKSLLEKPGIPTMPLPSKLTNTKLLMLDMPLIAVVLSDTSFLITVPASCGAKVFFTHTGICLLITGCIVGG